MIALQSLVLAPEVIARITELRLGDGRAVVQQQASRRRRRERLAPDGKLLILAADHPARRVTSSLGDPLGMASRADYLGRVASVLRSRQCDGLMATTDIVEDLFLLQEVLEERFLDGLLLIGSMNRGGLAGTVFELDDRLTSFTAARIQELRLDGGKLMFRIADDDPACAATLELSAKAIGELNALGLPSFVEALPVRREGGKLVVVKEAEALAKIAGVAAALGDSSLLTWLKLPYCDGYATVAAATTLPILLLGGEATGDPAGVLAELGAGLGAGDNVRGAMVGRNVLYPGEPPPASMASAVWQMVHAGMTAQQASQILG